MLGQQGLDVPRADLAASYTRAIVSAITKKAEAALERTGEHRLVLAGGVAANSHLRAALDRMCQRRGVIMSVPPVSLCGDNAAMVATAGYFEFLAGHLAGTGLNASAV